MKIVKIEDQCHTGTSVTFDELLLSSDCFDGQFQNGTIWSAPTYVPTLIQEKQVTIIEEETKYKPKFNLALIINILLVVIFAIALVLTVVIKRQTIDKAGK